MSWIKERLVSGLLFALQRLACVCLVCLRMHGGKFHIGWEWE